MQSFIGLALLVPEIVRGSLKTPLGPLNSKKKPGLNRVNVFFYLENCAILMLLVDHIENDFGILLRLAIES